MSLFEQLVQAVEEARGAATRAASREEAWAGLLSEQLAAYLNAPQEAVRYPGVTGGAMIHAGSPPLRDADGWHAFQLEIATDTQQRHRFVLTFLFRTPEDSREPDGPYRIKLGPTGTMFSLPSQREEFFDHVFVVMLDDLKTPEGRESARAGGVRKIG